MYGLTSMVSVSSITVSISLNFIAINKNVRLFICLLHRYSNSEVRRDLGKCATKSYRIFILNFEATCKSLGNSENVATPSGRVLRAEGKQAQRELAPAIQVFVFDLIKNHRVILKNELIGGIRGQL